MELRSDRVLVFLSELRDYIPDAVERFTQGSCFGVFRLIRAFEPSAEAWYDQIGGHVYTKVGDKFYDITGRILQVPKSTYPINTHKPRLAKRAYRWRFQSK